MKFIPITIQQNTFFAANLDNKVDDYFAENKDEIYYGNINIQPLLYKDAVIRMSSSVTKARSGNEKMALISNSKQLEMHSSKTVLVSFGSKKQQKTIEEEIRSNPVYFNDFVAKKNASKNWLGDKMHEGGLEKSVEDTVNGRQGVASAAIFEVILHPSTLFS